MSYHDYRRGFDFGCFVARLGREEAAEQMRERCAQTVREWGSDYPGSRLVAAIRALEVDPQDVA